MIDIAGLKSGRITAVSFSGVLKSHAMWLCRCDCGGQITIRGESIRRQVVKSCGCIQRASKFRAEHMSWRKMRERCWNPNCNEYKRYGARGISVCDRWSEPLFGFSNFISDMGVKPSSKHTIDRKDSNGNYCPENCRWATPVEQANNRRSNHNLTHNGRTLTVAQWSRELGLNRVTILRRLKRNLSTAEALTQ